MDEVLSEVDSCISIEMNERINRAFTPIEIYATLKSLSPLKALGKDGLGGVLSVVLAYLL